MKKILTILAAVAVLFGAVSCTTGTMHDAEVMLVDKVVVRGLTSLAGKEVVISGNWILGKDGKATWVHGLGDSTDIAAGAIGTVDLEGTVEFKINQLTSESTLEFLGKVNEEGWAGKFTGNDNVKITNTFTGSLAPKTILGVSSGGSITWNVVDVVAPVEKATYVNITAVEFKNVPGTFNGKTIGVVEDWIPGNDWAHFHTDMMGTVTGGSVNFTFTTPVKVTKDSIKIQSTEVKNSNEVDWDNKVITVDVIVPISFTDGSKKIVVDFASITGGLGNP